MSCCMDLRVRNQSPTAVTGRTACEVADSTGPNTVPIARRAGSTGEWVPGWWSSVISVRQASTRATIRERRRERSARWSNESGPGRSGR